MLLPGVWLSMKCLMEKEIEKRHFRILLNVEREIAAGALFQITYQPTSTILNSIPCECAR